MKYFKSASCNLFLAALLLLTPRSGQAQEPATSQWFKGNLHTHSLWSDGNDFPELICDWYKEHGYHFLALSDHNILSKGEKWITAKLPEQRGAVNALQRYQQRFGTEWVQTRGSDQQLEVRLRPLDEFRELFEEPGRFLLIQAEEITDRFQSLPVHINASNIQELIRPQGGESVREVIANNLQAVQAQSLRSGEPILAHLNHPNFGYAVTAEDLAAVVEERFFEVYNGHPGVHHLGDDEHVSVEQLWDIANTIRIAQLKSAPLYGLATDDSHHYFSQRGASPGRGWVMVRADRLATEELLAALSAGDFYASSGVTLRDVSFDQQAKTYVLRIDAEPDVQYTTRFIGTLKAAISSPDGPGDQPAAADGAQIGQVLATVQGAQPQFRLTGDELYVRAVVTSSRPHPNPSFDDQYEQAWTQPVGWQNLLAEPLERTSP